MMRSVMKIFGLGVLVLSLNSCVPVKRLTYLQDASSEENHNFQFQEYKVQPNDILNITIRTFDPETNSLFNTSNIQQNNGMQAGDVIFYIQGYTVDLNGEISMPVIGKLMVANLSIREIKDLIADSLKIYFEEEAISVTVQLTGIRFTVVGEVNSPGKYILYQNQANIFEALAMAGDVSIVGDRKEVMIVRQSNKQLRTISIDLTDRSLLENPDFFIMPNDIINVKPLPQKSYGTGTQGIQTFTQIFSLVASTITLIIAINSLNQ